MSRTLGTGLPALLSAAVTQPGYLVEIDFTPPVYLSSRGAVSWASKSWESYDIRLSGFGIDGASSDQAGSINVGNADNVIGALCLVEGVAEVWTLCQSAPEGVRVGGKQEGCLSWGFAQICPVTRTMKLVPTLFRSLALLALVGDLLTVVAQPAKKQITKLDDLPRHSYAIAGTATEVLTNATQYAELAAAVRKDIEGDLAAFDITDRPTRRGLLSTLMLLDLLEGKNDSVRERILAIRELEDKPAARLLTGLVTEVRLDVLKAQPGRRRSDSCRAIRLHGCCAGRIERSSRTGRRCRPGQDRTAGPPLGCQRARRRDEFRGLMVAMIHARPSNTRIG